MTKAAARFYFHGDVEGRQADALGNHWFDVGDDVPDQVVELVGDHLFEDDPDPEPGTAIKRRPGRPRKTPAE